MFPSFSLAYLLSFFETFVLLWKRRQGRQTRKNNKVFFFRMDRKKKLVFFYLVSNFIIIFNFFFLCLFRLRAPSFSRMARCVLSAECVDFFFHFCFCIVACCFCCCSSLLEKKTRQSVCVRAFFPSISNSIPFVFNFVVVVFSVSVFEWKAKQEIFFLRLFRLWVVFVGYGVHVPFSISTVTSKCVFS